MMGFKQAGRRMKGGLFVLLFLIFHHLPGRADSSADFLEINPVTPGPVSTLPRKSISFVLRIQNSDVRPHSLKEHLTIPDGWKSLTPQLPFHLEGGAGTVRIINLHVPLETQSGSYSIGYSVANSNTPELHADFSFQVDVLLLADIRIQKMSEPEMVIAGKTYRTEYALINASNAPCTVLLSVSNEPDYPFTLSEKRVRLSAGESRNIFVDVKTDKLIRTKTDYYHRIEARAESAGFKGIGTRIVSSTSIIPLINGTKPRFRKYPMELKFIGISDDHLGSRYQFGFYGSGALNKAGSSRIEFLLQGPGHNNMMTFGQIREEYRISIQSKKGSLHFGDRIFSLSKLTNFGHYGRGLEGRLNVNGFSLKFYNDDIHFLPDRTSQKGLQLALHSGESKVEMNYSHTQRQKAYDNQVLSMAFKLASKRNAFISGEYAVGQDSRRREQLGQSLWLEAKGNFPLLNVRAHYLFSDDKFPGTYQDLSFKAANLWLFPRWKISFTGSYYDQLKNAKLKIPGFSMSSRSIQTAMLVRFSQNLHLSFGWHQQDKKDLLPTAQYNYRDQTIQIGISSNVNFLNLQASYNFGKTDNLLKGESRQLKEYLASLTLKPFEFISIGGHFRYRDQDKDFTGDTTNYSSVSFDVNMKFGNTTLNALYRTSHHQEFFNEILNDQFLASQMIKNHMFMAQVSLRQKLPNHHTVGFHFRKVSSPLYSNLKDNHVGFIEYSIPLGIPLQRETAGGMLSGRIYERNHPKKGISGVIVRANGLTAVTDRSGRYRFLGMHPGKYYLSIDRGSIHAGYLPIQKMPMEILVPSNENLEKNIAVVPGGTIAGRITLFRQQDATQLKNRMPTNEDSKTVFEPLRGLSNIFVELQGESETRRVITNTQGEFVFHDVRPGKWQVRIHSLNLPEFHTLEQDVFHFVLEPGEKSDVEARVLPRIRTIKFVDTGTVKIKKK